jgi:hypothetical protein
MNRRYELWVSRDPEADGPAMSRPRLSTGAAQSRRLQEQVVLMLPPGSSGTVVVHG